MDLNDIRRYRGYMPVRMEREDALSWIGGLVGEGWLDALWRSKYSGYHEVRYRFGDVQQAQLYMKDKSWRGVPIGIWLKLSQMDLNVLDDECWSWINNERIAFGCRVKKAVSHSGGLLDL